MERREDPEEFGGYFIINGIERLVRLLIVPRRNHVLALIRPSFMKRGPLYTHFGVQIRSVRPDQSSQTCVLHYCRDGAVNFRFSYRKQEYIIPVMLILRSLKDSATDLDIFENLTAGDAVKDTFLTDRVELLLRSVKRYGLRNKKMTLAYLGSKFHVMLDSPEDCTEEQVGIELIKSVVLVHLNSNKEKFDMLM